MHIYDICTSLHSKFARGYIRSWFYTMYAGCTVYIRNTTNRPSRRGSQTRWINTRGCTPERVGGALLSPLSPFNLPLLPFGLRRTRTRSGRSPPAFRLHQPSSVPPNNYMHHSFHPGVQDLSAVFNLIYITSARPMPLAPFFVSFLVW